MTAFMAVPHEVLARVASCLPPCDRAALALAGRAAAAAVAASWTALRVPAGVLAAASPGHGRLRRHSGVRLLAITAAAGTGATPAAPAVAALLPAPEVLARLYELDCSAAGSAFWEATLAAAQRSGVPLTAALAAGAPHLQRLSLSCDLWYAPALAALQRACASAVPQMVKLLATTLARSGEVGLTLQPLAPLAALPSLRSLSLTGKPLPPPAAAQLPALTALHALSFNAALCCDDSALAHSLGGLTALTSLCLEHLPSHTGGVFAGLTGLTALQQLELSGAGLTMAGVASLAHLTGLTRLQLLGCPALQQPDRMALSSELCALSCLSELCLDCDLHLLDFQTLALLPALTSLTAASFHGCAKPGQVTPLPHLEDLTLLHGLQPPHGLCYPHALYASPQPTDALPAPAGTAAASLTSGAGDDAGAVRCEAGELPAFAGIPGGCCGSLCLMCPNLATLTLGVVSTAGLEAVAAHPRLGRLVLCRADAAQVPPCCGHHQQQQGQQPQQQPCGAALAPSASAAAEAWAWLATAPQLQELVLLNTDRILENVPAVALAGLQHIARIELRGYATCSDLALWCASMLLQGCRSLLLQGCSSLSDRGLLHLATLPGLGELKLQGCEGVTDGGVAALAAAAPALQRLALQRCAGTSADGCRGVEAARRQRGGRPFDLQWNRL